MGAGKKGTFSKAKATGAGKFLRRSGGGGGPSGTGGGGAATSGDIEIAAKRIKTTPSINKVKSLTFRKVGDCRTFVRFISSAGEELKKVKIPDKRGLLKNLDVGGATDSAFNMFLANIARPEETKDAVIKSASIGGLATGAGILGALGLKKLFSKKPKTNIKPKTKTNIKPKTKTKTNIKPKPKTNIKPKIKSTTLKGKGIKPEVKIKGGKITSSTPGKAPSIPKSKLIPKKGGFLKGLKGLKNIKPGNISKGNALLNVAFAGMEFSGRKKAGQTNVQAGTGAAASAGGGMAGAAAGAKLGVMLGMFGGPIGAAVGGAVGGIAGGIAGSMGATWIADKTTGADKVQKTNEEKESEKLEGEPDDNEVQKIVEEKEKSTKKYFDSMKKLDEHVAKLESSVGIKSKRIKGAESDDTDNKDTVKNKEEKRTAFNKKTRFRGGVKKINESTLPPVDDDETVLVASSPQPQQPMQGGGQGGGIVPIPIPGKTEVAVIGVSENEALNSMWTNILLTKLSS